MRRRHDDTIRGFTLGLGLFATFSSAGCRETLERPAEAGPLTFEVNVMAGQTGTVEAPLPFDMAEQFTLDIVAIDTSGQKAQGFDRDVYISINPVGELSAGQPDVVRLTAGEARGVPVQVEGVHGRATIWVEDKGTEEEPGSYATGLSPNIFVTNPRIRNVQETDNAITSALDGDFVEIDLQDRTAVVTAILNDGFYVTDSTDAAGGPGFDGIFAFTFSRPDGVEVGDRIVQLSGTVEEFFGFTELGFPSFKVEGTAPVPPPTQLTPVTVADDLMMERLESTEVSVLTGIVCPPGESFTVFGQWALLLDANGDCQSGTGAVTVVSAFTVDWFDPVEHVGETVSVVQGNLRYHVSAVPPWMIYPGDGDDIQL